MPSPLGHALAGVAAGWAIAGAPRQLRQPAALKEAVLFAALGTLPDVDLLFGMHSGPTHSAGAAMLVGVTAFACISGARPFPGAARFALACLAAYASHILLDWLGTDASPPLGIMALWPFDAGYYESGLHVFMAISRRYYQGWTFVEQNLRAVVREVAILMPLIAIIFLVRRRRSTAARAIAMLAIICTTATANAQPAKEFLKIPSSTDPGNARQRAIDMLVGGYRKGAIEPAIEQLTTLLSNRDGQRQLDQWIGRAEENIQREDLEALLLLVSEKVISIWTPDDPFPEQRLPPYAAALSRTHAALARLQRGTPFRRAWYLLWESFRQSNFSHPLPLALDYLDEALAEFPKNSEVLLAAGAREELLWWLSLENAQRGLSSQPLDVTRKLTAARDLLRRSLAADANESESRVRLMHVLLALNETAAIPELISSHDWTGDESAFRYLAALFEGDMYEQRNDYAAAAAAYDRASRLTDHPQSALIAKAHVSYLQGQRAEAAKTVVSALTSTSDGTDPWWPYIYGLSWRFDSYRKSARAMVMK